MFQFNNQFGKATGKGGKGKSESGQDIEKLKLIPPEQKVWVGGLSGSGVTWKQLQEHFNQISKTIYAAVFDKNGTGCVAYQSALEVQQAVTLLDGTNIGNAVLQVDFFTKPDNRESTPKKSGKSAGKSWGGKSAGNSWGKSAAQAQSTATSVMNLQNLVKQFMLKDSGGCTGGAKGKGKNTGKVKGGKGGKGGKGKNGEDIEKLKTIDNSLKVWVGGLTKEVTWQQLEEHFQQAGDTTWSAVFSSGTGCVAYKTAEEAQTAIVLLNGSTIGSCILEVDVFQKTAK